MLAATAVLGTVVALAYAPMWVSAVLGLGLLGATLVLSEQFATRAHPGSDKPPTSRAGVSALEAFHTDAVLLLSSDRQLEAVTASASTMLGWRPHELDALGIDELVHQQDLEALDSVLDEARSSG